MIRHKIYDKKFNLKELAKTLDTHKEKLDSSCEITDKLNLLYKEGTTQEDIDEVEIELNLHDKAVIDVEIKDNEIIANDYVNTEVEEFGDPPKDVFFNRQYKKDLKKQPVKFNKKGQPVEVIYKDDLDNEVIKRTWDFKIFNKETIITELGVSEPFAESIADDLIWNKKETIHWAKRNGQWSEDIKVKEENYIPFNEGVPDLASYYNKRLSERKVARQLLLDNLQVEIIPLIMSGGSLSLHDARIAGMGFLKEYDLDFNQYISSGDETIYLSVKNDATYGFLDYVTNITDVDNIRQLIINRLKQLDDITMDI